MDKDKIYNKWKHIIDAQNRTTTLTKEELEEWWKNHTIDTTSTDPNIPLLPTAIRISARTLSNNGGEWVKSKKQQLKENRLNKLRQLQGEEPNVVLPNDEYVEGLVAVKPLSAPTTNLYYADFKYK